MKISKKFITSAIVIFLIAAVPLLAGTAEASHSITLNVNEIAVMGLNDTGSITLETGSTVDPGANPTTIAAATNSDKYLKYTSIVNDGATRSITVALSTGVPAGTQLTVQAADAGTTGDGTPVGSAVTLSTTDQNLITGIGSCATGTTNGADLTYSYTITDVTLLEEDSDATITVTYTLTDDA